LYIHTYLYVYQEREREREREREKERERERVRAWNSETASGNYQVMTGIYAAWAANTAYYAAHHTSCMERITGRSSRKRLSSTNRYYKMVVN
jgi:hypothetical protein